MRLPSGRSPREAKVGILEVGPLHNNLEKGWSEPRWIGFNTNYPESGGLPSQEDSFGIDERLQTQWLRGRAVIAGSANQMDFLPQRPLYGTICAPTRKLRYLAGPPRYHPSGKPEICLTSRDAMEK